MTTNKDTIRIRVPRDVITDLRTRYPKTKDSDLIRLAYNTSLIKAEVILEKKDFKNKLGKAIYGNFWKKI